MKKIIFLLAVIGMTASTYMSLFYAPTEKVMGDIQRIFYFHMGTVWVSTIAFILVFIASIMFLVRKTRKWDILAYSSAEIGVVFITLTIISGSIWAKPIWGTWWTWDPQLTTTFILWMLFIVYLILRSSSGNDQKKAKYAAVYAIVAFLDLPLVYISARVMRGISPVVFGPGGGGIDIKMLETMLVTFAGFTFLMVLILFERIKIENLKYQLDILKSENNS